MEQRRQIKFWSAVDSPFCQEAARRLPQRPNFSFSIPATRTYSLIRFNRMTAGLLKRRRYIANSTFWCEQQHSSLTIKSRFRRLQYFYSSIPRFLKQDIHIFNTGIHIVMISPGRVDTRLMRDSGWTGPSVSAEKSASAVIKRIESLAPENNGRLIMVNGKALPWQM